jgi:phage repressor protein C with HTH and peptisase S24 domain
MCDSVRRVMKTLESMRSDRDDLSDKVKSARVNLEKLRKGKNEDKVRQSEAGLSDAEAKERLSEESLKITEELFQKELERFELERKEEMEELMRQFVSIRIESAALVRSI